jgi:predicted nucleic acid-binding protein
MIEKVCVDSNVLIYSMDPQKTPQTAQCDAWLNHLAQTGQIALSPQAITESVNVLVRRRLQIGEIKSLVAPFLGFVTHPINTDVIQRALAIFQRHQTSWWDALMIGWAAEAGCSVLLTEDAQSAPMIEGVRIVSPFDLEPGALSLTGTTR